MNFFELIKNHTCRFLCLACLGLFFGWKGMEYLSKSSHPRNDSFLTPVQSSRQQPSIYLDPYENPRIQEQMQIIEKERKEKDQSIWKMEVDAGRYEDFLVTLWDDLRSDPEKYPVFNKLSFQNLMIGTPLEISTVTEEITKISFSPANQVWTSANFRKQLNLFQEAGYEIVQTEWHHLEFFYEKDVPHSRVKFVLHVKNPKAVERLFIKGELLVEWERKQSEETHSQPLSVHIDDLHIFKYKGLAPFQEVLSLLRSTKKHQGSVEEDTLVIYDLNQDGLVDIINGGNNTVLWNQGNWGFEEGPLCDLWNLRFEEYIIADFTGDGLPDIIGTSRRKIPVFYQNTGSGSFKQKGRTINAIPRPLQQPSVLSAGDVDQDGDLDLWIGQLRPPGQGKDRTLPYYDDNNGYPAYLLINQGDGFFVDETEQRGLGKKRFRRNYSASFIDFDEDGDLDLITANDFAGIDLHENQGHGIFKDITDKIIDEHHLFGMSLTFADFNSDNRIDFFATGMHSVTIERLVRMRLGRGGFPKHDRMRSIMSYGNRLYLFQKNRFQQPLFKDRVANAGWAWGSTSFDFDNDGDLDIYVTNGHISGTSVKDYCSTFWRHDIYDKPSPDDQDLYQLFYVDQTTKAFPKISWNGFEHNRLFLNMSGRDFVETGWLMGIALENDSRATISADFDNDGHVDLGILTTDVTKPDKRLVLYRNNWKSPNNWIGVKLKEEGKSFSPMGAIIRVKTANKTQVHHIVSGDGFRSQHPTVKHFGLGTEESVEAIEVTWANGHVKKIAKPLINRYYTILGRQASKSDNL